MFKFLCESCLLTELRLTYLSNKLHEAKSLFQDLFLGRMQTKTLNYSKHIRKQTL